MRMTRQRFAAVPFVLDMAHQQRTIEMDGSRRKDRSVLEEARFDAANCQGLDVPIQRAKLETVEHAGTACRGVSQGAVSEELRGLSK